jgi:hypothetical protein
MQQAGLYDGRRRVDDSAVGVSHPPSKGGQDVRSCGMDTPDIFMALPPISENFGKGF